MNTLTIPKEEYNAMEGKMESTSLPHWQKYYAELKAFNEMMYTKKPVLSDFTKSVDVVDYEAYGKAINEWRMALSCDAPNRPGYYRANND